MLSMALLSSRDERRRANRYLGLLTLLFSVALANYVLDYVGLTATYPWVRTLQWPKEFFYGPLIYFYVRELSVPNPSQLRGQQWLHFVPAGLHVMISWSLLSLSGERQLGILTGAPAVGDEWLWMIFGPIEQTVTMLVILLYLFISLKLLRAHTWRVLETYSYTEKLSLDWLRHLIIGLISIYLIWVLQVFSPATFWKHALDAVLGLGFVVLIYSMGYKGLRQPRIFHLDLSAPLEPSVRSSSSVVVNGTEAKQVAATHEASDSELVGGIENTRKALDESASEDNKYSNSPLSMELSQALLEELKALMAFERPYLDSQLTLPQLAAKLHISAHYLSQVINQQLQMNFFDFINGHRIESSLAMLQRADESGMTVLDIAMASGFNSKSAFYSAFKKHQGVTPGEYRKRMTSAC
jgi:AraC-like DNA-binding protein